MGVGVDGKWGGKDYVFGGEVVKRGKEENG